MNSFRYFLPWLILISIQIGINCIYSIDDDTELDIMYRRLSQRITCNNKALKRRIYQKGKFWVVQNYVAADHGQIDCSSSVTLTTISDVGYLENLAPLIRRWRAPIGLTLYAPGDDLKRTVDSIRYLRNCLRNAEDSMLIKEFVSFHLFFDAEHITERLPHFNKDAPAFCERDPMVLSTYRNDHNLSFNINVPRNIAQDAAITHFILPSDIELYPSENLVLKFLHMLAFDERTLVPNRVYVIPAFEVTADTQPPANKRQLVHMLHNKTAVEFHVRFCEACSKVPDMERWKGIAESDEMRILTTVKRIGEYNHWEPFFIASQKMPYYEERHFYAGKSDRMTQATILCLLDYDFSVLDGVFLVHHPGIKSGYPKEQKSHLAHVRRMINEKWIPEYVSLFGPRDGCHL